MRTEKVAILFNPAAGKGKAFKKKDQLEKILKRFEINYDIFISRSEDDLKEIARENLKKYKTIVGAGGDSTFNIIINEIKKKGSQANFGMIGLGSSNDIAKEFNVSTLENACMALRKKYIKRIDLGCIVKDKTINFLIIKTTPINY